MINRIKFLSVALVVAFTASTHAVVSDVQTIILEDISGGSFFTVLEVEANEQGSGVNVAFTGTASATSAGFGGAPVGAIDGEVTAGCCGQLWHGNGANSVLTVALPSPKALESLDFSGRIGCCGQGRSDNFRVRLLDSNNVEVHNEVVLGAGTASAGGAPVNIPLGAPVAIAAADPFAVNLVNATATFDQGGAFTIGSSIDGIVSGNNGWGIFGQQTQNQVAVFQTDAPLDADGLRIDLLQQSPFGAHKIQNFRLSFTTDANPTATDGAINWIVIDPDQVSTSDPGTNALINLDGTILVSGTNGVPDSYEFLAEGNFFNVTGFRLEALTGANGTVGFSGSNGNIVLSEFRVTASLTPVPEPATAVMALFGAAGLLARRRRSA